MTDSPPTIEPVIGIIGGSGLYDIDGLEEKTWKRVATPWGEPSDELLFGRLGGVQCVFLPRHGRGHPVSPTHLNPSANRRSCSPPRRLAPSISPGLTRRLMAARSHRD